MSTELSISTLYVKEFMGYIQGLPIDYAKEEFSVLNFNIPSTPPYYKSLHA